MKVTNPAAGPLRSMGHLARIRMIAAGLCMGLAGVAGMMGLIGFSSASSSALLDEGVVRTTDGKTFEGDITEDDEEVQVNANGIITRVPMASVASIEYGSLEERLRKQHDALQESDYEGRLAVARQALGRDLFDLAEEIVTDVRNDEPGNVEAQRLLDRITQQRELEQARGTGSRRDGQRRPERATTQTLRSGDMGVLEEEEINLIRQIELQSADTTRRRNRVRVNFRDGVLRRFVETQPGLGFREFNNNDDVLKALYILDSDADRDIKDDVVITSDPVGVLTYLREVEPIILNGCATSECHGSPGRGKFALYPRARDAETSYTNFFLLNTYSQPVEERGSGAFGEGPVARKMIDRVNVDQSLLLNYMLPPDRATYGHPPVEGFTPIVADTAARNFQTVRTWIAQVLRRLPGTGYGFEFEPDIPSASAEEPETQPATEPAESQDSADDDDDEQ